MDKILGVIGLLVRLPFYLIGVAVVGPCTVVASAVLGLWHFVCVPVLWLATMPLRLFVVPARKGGVSKLKSGIESDIAGWHRTRERFFSEVNDYWHPLNKFLFEGF